MKKIPNAIVAGLSQNGRNAIDRMLFCQVFFFRWKRDNFQNFQKKLAVAAKVKEKCGRISSHKFSPSHFWSSPTPPPWYAGPQLLLSQTDYVDVYYLHQLPSDHNVADFMKPMVTVVAAGKVRHVGLSEATQAAYNGAKGVFLGDHSFGLAFSISFLALMAHFITICGMSQE